ncbi:MAG: hypothetical protein K6F24_01495 [Atopobiaceae bacterium]|nr:hypothetical protein [Atopobiaceae bacterium]
MVNRAQLAASLAALFWQRYYDDTNLAHFWQRHSDSTKASKELQASHTKKVAAIKRLPAISWSQLPDLNW